MRLIDADKVKELIKGPLSVDTDADKEYVCGLIDKIESGWISVKDRMPEENGEYIIAICGCVVTPCYYKTSKGWCLRKNMSGYFTTDDVTHWMELPAAPEAGT